MKLAVEIGVLLHLLGVDDLERGVVALLADVDGGAAEGEADAHGPHVGLDAELLLALLELVVRDGDRDVRVGLEPAAPDHDALLPVGELLLAGEVHRGAAAGGDSGGCAAAGDFDGSQRHHLDFFFLCLTKRRVFTDKLNFE